MTNHKILSIIVPTYNMEKYLRKCLDSLIVSDDKMILLEVLIINDGSKDSSSQIAHEYEKKFPQTFRVIDKENGNYGSCINRGLKEATGKYVKVLDADDSFDNKHFSDFILFLSKCNEDIVVSDYVRVSAESQVLKKFTFNITPQQRTTLDMLSEKIIAMHALTYKLQLLKDMGYTQTEGISYTDSEWAIIPITCMQTVVYYPFTIYKYLIGRENQTIDYKVMLNNREQLFTVYKKILQSISTIKCTKYGEIYILSVLGQIISFVYFLIIVIDKCRLCKELIEFDKELKSTYPQYYHLLDDVTLFDEIGICHYIRDWRKDYSNRSIYIFIVFYRFFATIKKTWIRLFVC